MKEKDIKKAIKTMWDDIPYGPRKDGGVTEEKPIMEKRKNWEERYDRWFAERFGQEYVGTFPHGDLYDFVQKELDRAREEGVKDGMRGMIDILCEKGCGSVFAVIKEKDVNKKIRELSKLKTK